MTFRYRNRVLKKSFKAGFTANEFVNLFEDKWIDIQPITAKFFDDTKLNCEKRVDGEATVRGTK